MTRELTTQLRAIFAAKYGEYNTPLTTKYDGVTLKGYLYGNDECYHGDDFYQYFVARGQVFMAYYSQYTQHGEYLELDMIDYNHPIELSDVTSNFVNRFGEVAFD